MKSYFDLQGDGGSNIAAQVAEQQKRLLDRLARVRWVVAVMSGKGGVGKSLLTANLALAFAAAGRRVGVLDGDLNGPSIAAMLGVRQQRFPAAAQGLEPARSSQGIKVLSMDLFLAGDATPVTWEGPPRETYMWRGNLEVNTLRHFLTEAAWGELDFLLIDLPPGTDRLQNVSSLLPESAAAVVVTIPSEMSQFIVGKSITMATEVVKRRVLGVVENMAGYVCQGCGEIGPLFSSSESAVMLAARHGVPYLGGIPFDPRLGAASDAGRPFLLEHPEAPASRAITSVARLIEAGLVEVEQPSTTTAPATQHGDLP
ncbi:MAG: P-loop NTPase [Candidatus Tectomicrobia bacterium]|nr:P-loop NTPase [Candidatus Tectomicrobia bacterium]